MVAADMQSTKFNHLLTGKSRMVELQNMNGTLMYDSVGVQLI